MTKGVLVLVCHKDAAREWGTLGSQALTPSENPTSPKSTVGQYRGKVLGKGI